MLAFSNRAFQYGDGVFTTIRVSRGHLQLWPLHWQRLALAVKRLGLPAVDQQQVYQQALAAVSADEQVLKILLCRGEGGRGYGTSGCVATEVFCWTSALPDYQRWQQQGVRVGLAAIQLSVQPLLAGLKHCSRLETILLKREVEQSGCDELLAGDSQGLLVEASASNVCLYIDGEWLTPELPNAGVAGVMRQCLLDLGWCKEARLGVGDAHRANAMLLTNSLMPAVPVRQYQQSPLDLARSQTLVQRLVHYLQNH